MSKLCLVTGANGHLGNNLVRALLARDERVRASVRNPNDTTPFEGLDCEIVRADLLDKDSLLQALEGVDTLYQAAAVFKHWARDPQKEIIGPNLVGTRNVLEAAAECGVGKVVYVSSTVTLDGQQTPADETSWNTNSYGNPYLQSKTEAEKLAWRLAEELGLQMVTVLPSGLVGPHCHRLTPTMSLLRRALHNEIFSDVNFHFNFADVRDVTAGIIAAAEKGRSGERYILATEPSVSTAQMLRLAQEFNPKVKIPPRPPKFVLLILASIMEMASRITGKEPMMLRSQVKLFYGVEHRISISKARTELGYDPRPPEQAIREAFAYLAKRESVTMKYKRVVITRNGGPEVLQTVAVEQTEPQPGQVRVKVLATGVAFADILMRRGAYLFRLPQMPFAPGYDIVGIVDKLGPGVNSFLVGQMVAALTGVGGYTQYLAVPEEKLVPVPDGVDPAEAVSLVLNYLTAYQMMHRAAKVKTGESVLIHSAAGGVGTALLQLGKLAELKMYGTASRPKHELVKKLGGTPIDYKNDDFVTHIQSQTPGGVGVVFDPIGGLHLFRSYRVLRRGGRVVVFGFSSVLKRGVNNRLGLLLALLPAGLLMSIPVGRRIMPYNVSTNATRHPDWYRADLAKLFNLLVAGKIKPVVAERLPLEQAAHAHELLENARVTGKLVLVCDEK
ncbi:MAG: NAD-dependent epimerase/dehydratase family protein [Anaerolineales bacterium]